MLLHEITPSVRALVRRPGFTAVAIGTIGLAIAANTAVFSVVNGALLRPLPFPDAGRLVALDARAHTGYLISLSIPNYRDWRDRNRVFDGFAASAGWSFTLTGRGAARVVGARTVIGDFFGLLGMHAVLGRVPSPDETPARPGADRLAVLSHGFWRELGGDPAIVGRALTLDGTPFTVVGVLRPGVGFPSPDVDLYVPMGADPALPWNDRSSAFGTEAFARLAPGITLEEARQDLNRVGREIRATDGPEVAVPEVQPLTRYFVGDVSTELWVVMGAVACVLLIAVANVGNLMLVRGEERQRELAVRSALGAGRGAIGRLLMTEAMLVAAAGAALGAVLAYAAVGGLARLLPPDFPALLLARVRVNGVVLAFAVGLALASGALFGLMPALGATGTSLESALRSGSRATDGAGRLRSALVVGEVAVALVLLAGAGLMIRSLTNLRHVDKGFRATNVLTGAVPVSRSRYPDKQRWRAFYGELEDRAAALPGVRAAALTLLLPLEHRSWELLVHPEGVPVRRETGRSMLFNVVSPEYFGALSVPILRGRGFTAADRDGTLPVTVIDETMAQLFWPGQDPLGQRVTFDTDSSGAPVYRTVVGVARNVRHYTLASPSRIQAYVPFAQTGRRWGMDLRLVLKTDVPPDRLIAPLRGVVTRVDPEAPLTRARPLADLVADALAPSRALTRVLTAFGAGALALAALGIFGVMSYTVSRRTREIGLRMALGAAGADVLRWVVARALRLTLGGMVLGVVTALGTTRVLRGVLFEVSPIDPLILVGVTAALGGAALLAAYLPARRATRVDPMAALNTDA